MIIFYKTPTTMKEKLIVKRSFKKSGRAIPLKKLTKNNKAFLQAIGFKV